MRELDLTLMQRALDLAERGRGQVEPNPLVGALVARDGQVVGEGWHERFGEAHAEVHALSQAAEKARGATLYVTLEPCCHRGKTPPCTAAILRAGIRRVVAAMADPFPQVAGRGAELLRQAGVDVAIGVGQSLAGRLNAPYLTLLASGRPYVHAKWAMTLDGKIATRTGDSRWVSNEASRRRVHELRGRMDGIVAGIGTVLADDPLLTARPPGPRTPLRIVLDSHARLPLSSQMVATARQFPLLLVTADGVEEQRIAELQSRGCQWLGLPAGPDARPALNALLAELGRRQLTNLLVEGGSEVLGSFLDAGRIDEVHVFVAPKLAGGAAAKPSLGGKGVESIADSLKLDRVQVEMLEGDIYVHGWREPEKIA